MYLKFRYAGRSQTDILRLVEVETTQEAFLGMINNPDMVKKDLKEELNVSITGPVLGVIDGEL